MSFELGTDGPGAIVAGIDGSRASLRAAAYAAGLARRQRAKLYLVYVRQTSGSASLTSAGGMLTAEIQRNQDQIEAELRDTVRQAAPDGLDFQVLARTGDPAHELSAVATEVRADEIVVGSSEAVSHRVIGSVGTRLIRARKWPVTVVP